MGNKCVSDVIRSKRIVGQLKMKKKNKTKKENRIKRLYGKYYYGCRTIN